ncbi:MAG: ImmA/IrrE family metallo-endopeptidase, partial [Clostridia bacterium]|nr:ImmA/IrrE family metallo-endopeptidase [Clostridia bacterium]
EISLSNVNLSLKQFMKDYDVTEYPVDCFRLVKKIQDAGIIHLEVKEEGRMSPAFNAVATYLPEVDSFQIVMKPVPEHWQQKSAWRRCNFTLAHELGHIFCGHLEIPKNMKTAERRRKDDLEADEFAARLLMPERLILKSRFSSFEELSKEFLVSDQACFKRMNNLKRLDLIRQPKQAACANCGNDHFSPAAEYCEICGKPLDGWQQDGVLVVEYSGFMADENNRVLFCPVCGNEEFSDRSKYCRVCGLPAYNWCRSDHYFRICHHANATSARYCELCGCKTEFSLRGLLTDWKKEKNEYIRAITQR